MSFDVALQRYRWKCWVVRMDGDVHLGVGMVADRG